MRYLAPILALFLLGAGAATESLSAQPYRARQGVQNGEVRSLGQIIEGIRRERPGALADVQGPDIGPAGEPHYRVKWLTPDGRVLWLDTDARTGRVLGVQGDDRRPNIPPPRGNPGRRNFGPPPNNPPPGAFGGRRFGGPARPNIEPLGGGGPAFGRGGNRFDGGPRGGPDRGQRGSRGGFFGR
jgi:hypothetical protein